MTDFQFDFSGVASKYNTKCNDGRVIRHGAFKENNGKIVPLVWQHDHSDPRKVLGKALLKDTPDGLMAYCSLNDTELGEHTKKCVKHGDLVALSVYANHIKENHMKVVNHGDVKEVSVVLAGCNPGAIIDNVMLHSDEDGMSASFRFYDPLEQSIFEDSGIIHSDEIYGDEDDYDDEEDDDEFDETEEVEETDEYEETEVEETEEEIIQHADTEDSGDRSVADVLKGIDSKLNEDEKAALEFAINTVVAQAVQTATNNNKEEDEMRHSLFDSGVENVRPYLTKEEQASFIEHMDEDHSASMKTVIGAFIDSENDTIQHDDDPAQTYGIINTELLFPDAKNYTDKPEFIKRRTEWVNVVLSGVHKTPFSKIKTVFADITADEARAKGYIKGDQKEDEVFELLQRDTSPQTIYKRQKFDRDDRIDIVDFDVIVWIKGEMRLMWEEEVARAILIGDGRSNVSRLKIKEDKIRPIWSDADLFTVPIRVGVASGTSDDARTRAIIRAIIKNRKLYKGSGSPTLFTTEDFIADCLLLTDDIGRDMYESIDKLATKLRVSKIVPVEVMEGKSRSVKINPEDQNNTTVYLDGIIVNLSDYNVGADKGGKAEMFEDFDLDFNQYIFLYEGRCSGALVKPYSAMAIEHYTLAAG